MKFHTQSFLILTILLVPAPIHAGQKAGVAGEFYPADKAALEKQVDEALGSIAPSPARPKILIVPHAGYQFSGPVAGRAYREIKGKSYDTVILLGTAHVKKVFGAALDPEGVFETPLGAVPVDPETSLRLLTLTKKIQANPVAFQGEHSIETQLPFLQRSLLIFKIVPLLMQTADLETAQEVGKALAAVIKENEAAGKRTLLVLSTDFAHYPNSKDAMLSDAALLKAIEAVDPEMLSRESAALMEKKIPNLMTPMCGQGAVTAGLFAAKELGISKAEVLMQGTSGDSKKSNTDRVVSYAAAVFYGAPGETLVQKPEEKTAAPVTTDLQKQLLASAREAVRDYLKTGKARGTLKVEDEALNKPQAVFVSLHKHGKLRGSVGTTYPKFPLKQAVVYYAIAAATQDKRFPPVTLEELESLQFEISIVSPQKQVLGPEAIEPGRDGVVMMQGNKVGLLMPQVWEETGWTKEQFLSELARQKAGLEPDAWKDPETKLYTFTTETFVETGAPAKSEDLELQEQPVKKERQDRR
jgi:AmmeMemoRadiSam system protein B/AmmeMemoRadiSam system protein A